MSILRGLRLVNSIEAGNTDAVELDTLLAGDLGRKSEFSTVLGLKGQARRVVSNSITMGVIAESDEAMGAVSGNPNAMGELASSPVGMTSVLSTNAGREGLFNSKFYVGKGLDTVISNETSVSSTTLAGQMTTANVMANAASNISANATVATAVANSPTAREAVFASEAIKQSYAGNTVAVAKYIEGELGGDPDTTTSLDTVLNASGRLAAILENPVTKSIASAADSTSTKLLAKIIGLDPSLHSSIGAFYGDTTLWNSVAANSDARSVCFNSAYLKTTLPFSKVTPLIISASANEIKPLWNWAKSTAGLPYFGASYSTQIIGSVAWEYNNTHYITFAVSNPSGGSYGIYALYTWRSTDAGVSLATNSPAGLGSSVANIFSIKKTGDYLFICGDTSVCATGSYYRFGADLTTSSIISTGSYQVNDIEKCGNVYVAGTSNYLAYSASSNASSWTILYSASGNFQFIGNAVNKYIAITSANVIWTSSDGTNWTSSGVGLPSSVSYLSQSRLVTNGSIAFIFNKRSNKLFSSSTTSLVSWSTVSLPDGSTKVNGFMHDGTMFYMATDKGFYTSGSGATWTKDDTVTTYGWMGHLTGTSKFIMGLEVDPGYGYGFNVRNIGN